MKTGWRVDTLFRFVPVKPLYLYYLKRTDLVAGVEQRPVGDVGGPDACPLHKLVLRKGLLPLPPLSVRVDDGGVGDVVYQLPRLHHVLEERLCLPPLPEVCVRQAVGSVSYNTQLQSVTVGYSQLQSASCSRMVEHDREPQHLIAKSDKPWQLGLDTGMWRLQNRLEDN
eukprot:260523-Pyramimonas_sp.AAC.1